jgi:c(7)-type cytochrome triheme protein
MGWKIALVFVVCLVGSIAFGMVGGGDITFEPKDAGQVIFSHESHVGVHFQACTDCHASPFTTRAQHKQVSMAQMAQGLSCGACHNGTWAFSVKENCQICHH